MSEEQEGSARQVDYERFCTYAQSEALGAEIQGEFFYLVQPYKISVYQYYTESKKPQLIEELIYNKLILHYAINQHYICILTSSFLEIRDRQNWNKLIHTHPTPQPILQPSIILDKHFLYLSTPKNDLCFQRIDIREKEVVDIVCLGSTKESHALTKKPLFLRKMGNLEDFYLWSKDPHSVELGMLYSSLPKERKTFELSQIELKDHSIHKIYHHKVNCSQCPRRSSQYVIVVGEKSPTKQLVVLFYQILPKQLENDTQDEENFEAVVQQIQYLGNFNQLTKAKSLVTEVFEEASDDSCDEESSPHRFELCLLNMKGYESSFYQKNRLWVLSSNKICFIELISESTIEDLIKEQDSKENPIIKTIDYQPKKQDKIGVGIYQDSLLFIEHTVSYVIGYQKEYTESIAEEIIQDQELEDNLEKKKDEREIEEMYKNIIDRTIEEKQKEMMDQDKEVQCIPSGLYSYKSHYTRRHDKQSIYSKVYSETHHQLREGTAEFGIQTEKVSHKIDDLEEVEMLVAKYSSAVSVSCSKVKQSQIQKDKFDKEIKHIVDSMAKTVLEPFLEERFVGFLEAEVQKISFGITTVLLQQLQALNETMKKIEAKENHLRGKRIYDFVRQMQNIKISVSGVFDALKEREITKIASNELILEEARSFKEKAQDIEKQIIQISAKNESSEGEINEQIREIMTLVTKMCNQEEKPDEDSQAEVEESDEESSQEEKGQRKHEGSASQNEQSFQEEEHPRMSSYQPMPYPGKGHPDINKSGKFDSRRYPYSGYYPEYVPPPPPPQYPFYYPYGPQNATLSYQSLYPPPIHQMSLDPYSCSSSSVAKKDKKRKR